VEQLAPYKVLKLILKQPLSCEAPAPYGQVNKCDGIKATLRVPRETATEAAAGLLTAIDIEDVTIEEPPIEEIVSEMFNRGQMLASQLPPEKRVP
jgi:ABC-2 type transport system ATP-binding protein